MAAIQRPAALPRLPRGRVRSGWLLLACAAALLIGAAALQVNQFSAVTGTGYEIEELKRARAEKQATNHDLEAEVARLSSLARVEIEARARLGMGPPAKVVHLDIVGTVPDHQTLPTRYLPHEQAAEDIANDGSSVDNGSFWDHVLDLLPF
jgi:cell division protein FtsL